MNSRAFAWLAALAALAAVPSTGSADATAGAAPPDTIACTARTQRGDLHEYACPLVARGARHFFKVTARFSGSHDDTMASLVASIGGAPVACDAESKTRTMGEDGDVSVDCRFALGDGRSGPTELLVVVKWTHAQFVGFAAEVE